MPHFGLALIYLKRAMRHAGCPVCTCCAEHEARYIRGLLWESVNDVDTRVHLARSFGFCGRHARQMLDIEREEYGSLLGNSIIYESLVQVVAYALEQTRGLLERHGSDARWLAALRGRIRIGGGGRSTRARYLAPTEECRVCTLSAEAAVHYGITLADMLAFDEYRRMYAMSRGVCLPHLRLMVAKAESESGIAFMLEHTRQQLAVMQQDLASLGRKCAISSQSGPVTEGEAHAVDDAIAFLAGSEPLAGATDSERGTGI